MNFFYKQNLNVQNRKKFFIYSLIQLLGFIIDLLVFYILYNKIYNSILLANFFSKFLSSYFFFMLHRNITFKKQNTKNIRLSFVKYYSFVLINIPVTSFLTFTFEFFISNVFFSKIISDVLYFFVNYFFSKKFIFN